MVMAEDRKVLQVRVPKSLYEDLSIIANSRGLNVSSFVRNFILEKYVFEFKLHGKL